MPISADNQRNALNSVRHPTSRGHHFIL